MRLLSLAGTRSALCSLVYALFLYHFRVLCAPAISFSFGSLLPFRFVIAFGRKIRFCLAHKYSIWKRQPKHNYRCFFAVPFNIIIFVILCTLSSSPYLALSLSNFRSFIQQFHLFHIFFIIRCPLFRPTAARSPAPCACVCLFLAQMHTFIRLMFDVIYVLFRVQCTPWTPYRKETAAFAWIKIAFLFFFFFRHSHMAFFLCSLPPLASISNK